MSEESSTFRPLGRKLLRVVIASLVTREAAIYLRQVKPHRTAGFQDLYREYVVKEDGVIACWSIAMKNLGLMEMAFVTNEL